MAVAAPLLASKFLIPAIGAVAGGAMAKKSGMNPLLGAAMGGLGGAALGPAMGAMGAASGSSALGSKAALAAGNMAMPVSTGAAMSASALPTAGMAELAMGLGPKGLLSNAMTASKALGSMQNMAQPQQPQMMPPPPPPPMAAQQRPGSMASLGVGQSMYHPRRTTYG